MLYYSIAHYYDRQGSRNEIKYDNIKKHIIAFLNTEEKEKEFILISFVDTPIGHIHYKNVKKHLEQFCQEYLPNKNFHILVEYNWGGTIAALWYTYKFLISNKRKGYVVHMEEDFGPKNNDWYNVAKKKLSNVVYVGESNIGRIKKGNDDNRLTNPIYRNTWHAAKQEVWTDGGFYFSTVKKLKTIEEKIGIFHKGAHSEKFDRILDGISIGEVGFPTLIYHSGLKFDILNRTSYFINEWNE
ncbi:MAG: hypothetical protein ACTSQG_11450 [Promethearchaeota archaeon]|jgi:hypothetical protein